MPVIRVDQRVYLALRKLQDSTSSPNDVIRGLLRLNEAPASGHRAMASEDKALTRTTASVAPKRHVSRKGVRTKEAAFRRPILCALSALGGKARDRDVLAQIESEVRAILLPADYE